MWKIKNLYTTLCNKSVSLIVKEVLKFLINGLFYNSFSLYFCNQMNHPKLTIMRSAVKKLMVLLVIAGSAVASFATLGDGNKKPGDSKSPLLSAKTFKSGSFSLRSGYTYRGNQVISPEVKKSYISMNTTITYQKGNTTFIVPLKKKVLLSNIKIDIGNRQFQRN